MNARLKTALKRASAVLTWLAGPTPAATYVRRLILGSSCAGLTRALPALYGITGTSNPTDAILAVAGTLVALAGIGGTLAHTHKRVKAIPTGIPVNTARLLDDLPAAAPEPPKPKESQP